MEEIKKFDTTVEPLDWRFSAAIVGLYKYLFYHKKDFNVTDDALEFNSSDITEAEYLSFAEYYYGKGLQHKLIENLLEVKEPTENQTKTVNDLFQANSILKKVFKKQKFDGNNQDDIKKIINENREALIKETFRNKKNMYADYANTNQLFNDSQDRCRLLGYYVDGGRKSKAISYNFDTKTYVGQDTILFDFIPFAFMGDRESYFINDSFSVEKLINTNIAFEGYIRDEEKAIEASEEEKNKTVDAKKVLFRSIKEIADFIDYDVEVIYKNWENEFFETMYVRKNSINVLKKMNNYNDFCRKFKVNDNYFIDIQQEVLNCILNLVRADKLIESYLKTKQTYMAKRLIELNVLICGGGENMKKSMQVAYACAKEVANKLDENKVDSYRQKLISSVVFKDYDRCCQILLQLSNYADVNFGFAYDLFDNFEENKDVMYTFINALVKNNKEDK